MQIALDSQHQESFDTAAQTNDLLRTTGVAPGRLESASKVLFIIGEALAQDREASWLFV